MYIKHGFYHDLKQVNLKSVQSKMLYLFMSHFGDLWQLFQTIDLTGEIAWQFSPANVKTCMLK